MGMSSCSKSNIERIVSVVMYMSVLGLMLWSIRVYFVYCLSLEVTSILVLFVCWGNMKRNRFFFLCELVVVNNFVWYSCVIALLFFVCFWFSRYINYYKHYVGNFPFKDFLLKSTKHTFWEFLRCNRDKKKINQDF